MINMYKFYMKCCLNVNNYGRGDTAKQYLTFDMEIDVSGSNVENWTNA
jgi:hypothetical protein